MSGGVDSSVAAALLVEAGHDVVGVTLKLWGGDGDRGCCSVRDVDDARRVAHQLGIDHLTFNFGDHFTDHVVDPYVAAHGAGRTPNPCVECNRHVKFDRLYRRAAQLGFDAVATGHHARIVERDGHHWVARGADRAKDQSYVVHMLDARTIARTLFPVGELTKPEVRRRASQLGLGTAAKPDSQDVCFISSTGGRRRFLEPRAALHPGRVVDTSGAELGRVEAVELVTIGQRRGLGALGGERRFVVDVDGASGVVTVGDAAALARATVELETVTWANGPVRPSVLVQCSAHARPQPATVEAIDPQAGVRLRWDEPQRRVAPGQSVVLYDGTDTIVLGGGIAR